MMHPTKRVKRPCYGLLEKQDQSEKAQLTSLSWGLIAVKGACWLRWGELPSMAE